MVGEEVVLVAAAVVMLATEVVTWGGHSVEAEAAEVMEEAVHALAAQVGAGKMEADAAVAMSGATAARGDRHDPMLHDQVTMGTLEEPEGSSGVVAAAMAKRHSCWAAFSHVH